jgi:hypothetical protein
VVQEAEAQERTQRCRDQLHDRDRAIPTVLDQVTADHHRIEGRNSSWELVRDDKCAHAWRVNLNRPLRKPLIVTQMVHVPLDKQLSGRWLRAATGHGADGPEVLEELPQGGWRSMLAAKPGWPARQEFSHPSFIK